MDNEIIGMIISLLGMCANVLSFQMKKKWSLLTVQTIGGLLFSIAFFFSGGGIGGIMNLLLLARNFVFMALGNKKGRVVYITIGVLFVAYIIGLLLYNFVFAAEQTTADKLWNLFPVLGGMIGTIAVSVTKLNLLRKIKLGDSACWLAYNIHIGYGALGGILCEIFSICSIGIALLRFREKNEAEKKIMIKAVIFDMDGTLVDSEPLHKISRGAMLKKLGLEQKVDPAWGIGKSKREYFQDLIATYSLAYDADELARIEFQELIDISRENGLVETRDTSKLLEILYRRGIRMAVASSSDRNFVEFVLKYMNWEKYFSVIVSGNDVKRLKPAPDIYLRAIEEGGVSIQETVAVEDSSMGIKAAKTAGLQCVGYDAKTAESSTQDFSLCDMVIDTMLDVLKFIDIEKV